MSDPEPQFTPRGGDSAPVEVSSRRQHEVEELLSMAEDLQEKIEATRQQSLATDVILLVVGLTGVAIVVYGIFSSQFLVEKILFISLGSLALLSAGFVAATRFRHGSSPKLRDINALNEVLVILHDIEPILRVTSDWSRLDEARFRIRLSRFDVGQSAKSDQNVVSTNKDRVTRTMRFLLDETNANYRQFVERLFGNIDVAIQNLSEAADFAALLKRAGAKLEVVGDDEFKQIWNAPEKRDGKEGHPRFTMGVSSLAGSYCMYADNRLLMTEPIKRGFESRQNQLRIQLEHG